MHDVATEGHAAPGSCRWTRGTRSPLLLAAALAAVALAPAIAAIPGDLRLVVAGPGGSAAHRFAEILADPLGEVLRRPVARRAYAEAP